MDKTFKHRRPVLILIYIFFVFLISYAFGMAIGLKLNVPLQIIIVFLVSIAIKYFIINPIIFYIALVLGFIITVIIQRFYSPILLLIAERLYLLYKNVLGNIQGAENITGENILLFWIFLLSLYSFMTAYVLFKDRNICILLPLYLFPLSFYWYSYYDSAYWLIAIFLVLFLILMGVKNFYKNGLAQLYRPWVKTSIIYGMTIILLALAMPKSQNYIYWTWMQKKVYSLFPFVEDFRQSQGSTKGPAEAVLFDFSTTGFQGNSSKLGGPVTLGQRKIMTLEAKGTTYLRGSVKQIYTGNSWRTLDEPYTEYGINRNISMLKNSQSKFFEDDEITITNHGMATMTLFSPLVPSSVSYDKTKSLWVNKDHVLLFPQGIGAGEKYTVKVKKTPPYDLLISLDIERTKEDLENLDVYLGLPHQQITMATAELAKEITKSSKNDYEKALDVESYLRQNFKYSLDVNEVPDNEEFVNYFLFNERKGYCTYFATAMAIMLRLEGIPTRYVEGYIAKEEVEPNIYEIRDKNAHTWVEAFIEPVGWMTFEPTPVYDLGHGTGNYTVPEGNHGTTPADAQLPFRNPKMDLKELMENEPGISTPYELMENDKEELSSKNIPRPIAFTVIGILLAIVPLKFITGLIYSFYLESKSKKLPHTERLIYLYKQILRIADLFGYPQKNGETHYEYADRIAYKFQYQGQLGIKEITDIFVKTKYGGFPVSKKDMEDFHTFRDSIDRHLKITWSRKVYYYRKYVKLEFIKG